MVFKPNRFKLYCPAVYLNRNIIDYVEKTKYLGYIMSTNDNFDKQDDVEMLRQLRLLYMLSNKIITLNTTKTHYMVFDRGRKQSGNNLLTLNNKSIGYVKFTKFLGVIIDDNT